MIPQEQTAEAKQSDWAWIPRKIVWKLWEPERDLPSCPSDEDKTLSMWLLILRDSPWAAVHTNRPVFLSNLNLHMQQRAQCPRTLVCWIEIVTQDTAFPLKVLAQTGHSDFRNQNNASCQTSGKNQSTEDGRPSHQCAPERNPGRRCQGDLFRPQALCSLGLRRSRSPQRNQEGLGERPAWLGWAQTSLSSRAGQCVLKTCSLYWNTSCLPKTQWCFPFSFKKRERERA